MPIPDYQTLMRPLLALLADGKVHPLPELRKGLISGFQLTEEEVKVRLPGGGQAVISNRIGWVGAYLGKGELLRKSIESDPIDAPLMCEDPSESNPIGSSF
jgi:restriction system protein